ncbi:MAG: ABC transporter substrate-binding protein [Pseudomonadota bacterium]
MSTTPRVCGVPEHFNRAWRRLADAESVAWQEIPEGSGRMLELLDNGDTDIAILLTEGAIAGAARGVPLMIVGVWVESPLYWGVHVPASSAYQSADDLKTPRVAISRFGSGSHLMAGLYAKQNAWPQPVEYRIVNTLDGAREAFAAGDADVFLWERATTAPLVASGEFRRIDVLPTPWPCFVACCRRDQPPEIVAAYADRLQKALREANEIASAPDAVTQFTGEYQLATSDVERWLSETRWPGRVTAPLADMQSVADTLQELDLIETKIDVRTLLAKEAT